MDAQWFWPVLICALLAGNSLFAAHLPSHGAVIHLDLNPAGLLDFVPAFGIPAAPAPVVGGGCGVFLTGEFCEFDDALNSSPEGFHWESELQNSNAFPVAFNVGFFFPGGAAGIGRVRLGPGAAFNQDIHFLEVPEMGRWRWTVISALPFGIEVDSSVTENVAQPDEFVCGPGCSFEPDSSLGPDLRFTLTSVPEPATSYGMAAVAVLYLLGRRVTRKQMT